MADEPDEVTNERIYDDLKAYQDGGMLEYVLPTEPLGEEWIVGWKGQILKFGPDDGIVGFLMGIQVAGLFLADRSGPVRDIRAWLREPPEVAAAPVGEVRTEWCVAYGGDDPNDCAGRLTYDDEGEAADYVQWTTGGFVASRSVIATRWVRAEEADDERR